MIDLSPQRIEAVCPICSQAAVALVLPEVEHLPETAKVLWCEFGHVVVITNDDETKLVYEFEPVGFNESVRTPNSNVEVK